MGNLINLQELLLWNEFGFRSQLTGSIPAELGNLTNLLTLDLSGHQLTGSIPAELGNLTNLQYLGLSTNQLTGSIPDELGSLINLTSLALYKNNLSGPLPDELGSLINLTSLALYENNLSGPLPSSMTNLRQLEWLGIYNNAGLCAPADAAVQAWLATIDRFRGDTCAAPQPVGTLAPLTIAVDELSVTVEVSGAFLDPNGDTLTYGATSSAPGVASVVVFGSAVVVTPVVVGTATVTVTATDTGGSNTTAFQTFPVTVSSSRPLDRAALEALYDATGGAGWTNRTNWKTSVPLGEWFGVTTDAAGRVTQLDLEANGLAGPIPAALQGLANLELLNLGGNALTGPIPGALASLVNLEQLNLWRNQLTGPIPAWLGSMTRLRRLNLGRNAFSSGPIPGALASLVNLEVLYLYENNLTGPIPVWLGNLVRLEWLALAENSLSGEIPPALANLTSLERLFLYDNQLTGPIPPALANLTGLERLFLSGNQLTGPIPPWLADLADLQYLELQENGLTGRIPAWLGGLTNLRSLALGGSGLTGPIPRELGDLTNLERLYLWELGLTGPIPAWLGSLGNLRLLSLSRNGLTGAIPPELGSLANLQSLWLYENPLTGTVPESLTRLSLAIFWIHETGVCVPADAAFQAWIATIRNFRGDICTGPANRPPEAVGSLPPLTIGIDEGPVPVEVSGAFRDPDGDALTYGASSTAPWVARVSVSGSRVTVTPVAAGTASVEVTATDDGGSNTTATQTFGVTVRRPFTDHPIVPRGDADQGGPLHGAPDADRRRAGGGGFGAPPLDGPEARGRDHAGQGRACVGAADRARAGVRRRGPDDWLQHRAGAGGLGDSRSAYQRVEARGGDPGTMIPKTDMRLSVLRRKTIGRP